MQDKQALGTRVDFFAAHHQRLAHDVGAAVAAISLEEPEDKPVVAAVRPSGGKREARSCRGGQFRGGHGQQQLGPRP
jgi:hypothetical protein